MGFRTLEISQAAEIHIKEGQLEITSKDGTVYIPLEDLCQVMRLCEVQLPESL